MITRAKNQKVFYKGPDPWLEKICHYINKKSGSDWEGFATLSELKGPFSAFVEIFEDKSIRPDNVWIDKIKKILVIIEVDERKIVITPTGKKQENGAPPNVFKAHCWNLEEVQYRFPEWKIIAIDIAISPHIVKYKQICEESAKRKGLIYHLIPSFEYKIVQKEVYEILQNY